MMAKSIMMRVHKDFYIAVKRFKDEIEKTTKSQISEVDVTKLFSGKSPSVLFMDRLSNKRRKKRYEFRRVY